VAFQESVVRTGKAGFVQRINCDVYAVRLAALVVLECRFAEFFMVVEPSMTVMALSSADAEYR
jgi:hypothetical protein